MTKILTLTWYIAIPRTGTSYFTLAKDINEAYIDARRWFGDGISFNVRESSTEEFQSWVRSRP